MIQQDALTPAESAMLHAALDNQRWEPTDRPEIRGEVLRMILVESQTPHFQACFGSSVSSQWRGVRGITVTDRVDLEASVLLTPLVLEDSRFVGDEPIRLRDARAPAIDLKGCSLPKGMDAQRLETRGSFRLMNCTFGGQLTLLRAHIGGELDLTGTSTGENSSAPLQAPGLHVDQRMVCGSGFDWAGEVSLVDAVIGESLNLTGAHLCNAGGVALSAERLQVAKNLECGEGFQSIGEVRILGGHIGGDVQCTHGRFCNADGHAVNADHLHVEGSVFFSGSKFRSEGEVRLLGADIGGDLEMTRGKFINREGTAISAERLHVGHDLNCGTGFVACGAVRFMDVHVAGNMTLTGGRFLNADGTALAADRVSVDRDLSCCRGFHAQGALSLSRARVAGDLNLQDAELRYDGPDSVKALNLWGADVGGTLTFRPDTQGSASIDLRNAAVKTLSDDRNRYRGRYELSGLHYDSLDGDQDTPTVKERIDWLLESEGKYTPQIYNQLAEVYAATGNEDAAREVLIAKQRRRAIAHRQSLHGWTRLMRLAAHWVFDRILDWTIAYGYRPMRVVPWLLGLLVLGGFAFGEFNDLDKILPLRRQHTDFHSWLYTLDLLLPVANLKQRDAFLTHGAATWTAAAFTILGWVLAAILVAGLSGVFKRD